MQQNPYRGKFIVFEGLDGSGQTTQAALLKNFLVEKGYQVVLTKEPTKDSRAGKKIRKILDTTRQPLKKGRKFHTELQELYAKDRRVHLKNKILPALRRGKTVISDRYFFTSFAFGTAKDVSLRELMKMNAKFLNPDLALILKVKPGTCITRIKRRGTKMTFFEEKKHFSQASKAFISLSKKFENAYIINGEKPIKKVFSQIKALFQSKLNL